MSLALLFHRLMLNMFRMLIHPSSGACDLRGLLEKYPTFGREKETGLFGALDT